MRLARSSVLGAVAVVVVAALAIWAASGDPAPDDPSGAATVPAPRSDDAPVGDDAPDPAPAPADVDPTPVLGHVGDLPVHLPSAAPIVVGFHEAATVHALDVAPTGQLLDDRNTTRTDLPDDDPQGPDYVVLTSRGRSAGPTSSIDVVLQEDDPVLAGVSGRVVDVRSYLLYGAHGDVRVEIVPDGRPDVRLVAIHLDGPAVDIGDQVIGGVTPIAASVRRFPFSSHIDRETEPERYGHVHLEVQPADLRRPGDDTDDDEVDEDAVDDDEVAVGS